MSMKSMKTIFACCLLAMFVNCASAQQPGSVQYNTQVLPANGIVARNVLPDRWAGIAIANDKSDRLGWIDNAATKEDAVAGALESCRAVGGGGCEVIGTFANSCAALAFGAGKYAVSFTNETRRSVAYTKKDALRKCGQADCRIVRAGCTVPN